VCMSILAAFRHNFCVELYFQLYTCSLYIKVQNFIIIATALASAILFCTLLEFT